MLSGKVSSISGLDSLVAILEVIKHDSWQRSGFVDDTAC